MYTQRMIYVSLSLSLYMYICVSPHSSSSPGAHQDDPVQLREPALVHGRTLGAFYTLYISKQYPYYSFYSLLYSLLYYRYILFVLFVVFASLFGI